MRAGNKRELNRRALRSLMARSEKSTGLDRGGGQVAETFTVAYVNGTRRGGKLGRTLVDRITPKESAAASPGRSSFQLELISSCAGRGCARERGYSLSPPCLVSLRVQDSFLVAGSSSLHACVCAHVCLVGVCCVVAETE